MAFLKITQLPSNDSDISYGDLLTVVDVETGTNRKMTIEAFRNWIDEELGEHYTSDDFTQDLLDAGIADRLDSEHAWNVSDHNDIKTNISDLTVYVDAKLDSVDGELSQIEVDIRNLDSNISDLLDSLQLSLESALDSEHGWNVSEHSSLRSDLDSLDADVNTRLDSLETSVIAELTANLDSAVIDLNSSIDSEHTWNLAEHQSLSDASENADSDLGVRIDVETQSRFDADSDLGVRIDAETQLRSDADSDLGARIDVETQLRSYADSDLGVRIDAETQSRFDADSDLGVRIDVETQLRSDADSDLGVRIDNLDSALDSEHAWNVSSHSELRSDLDSLDADVNTRLDSLETSVIAELTANLDSAVTDLNASIDSEHAWNISEHSLLDSSVSVVSARLDSEHSWNISQHSAEATARENADSDLNSALSSRLDSEHGWNVTQHATEVTARENADSDLNSALSSRLDSEHSWNISQHSAEATARENEDSDLNARLDSEHGWNVSEHATEATARENADSDLQASLDSEHAWNVSEHASLLSVIDSLNTNEVEEGSNLYFTTERVSVHIDSEIDDLFLDGRMALDNLSDVQLTTPDLNEVLHWNGSVWSNQSIGIVGTLEFRGTVDATVDAAPGGPSNGDFYVNLASGNALGSWTGLSTVDSGDGLAWDSNASNWRNLGATSSSSVVRVLAGTAISVDETDTARPVVAVRKDITDTWYYNRDSVDAISDSEHAWNLSEHTQLQSSIDSGYAWNRTEHAELQANLDSAIAEEVASRINSDSDLQASLDSEHAWNISQHSAESTARENSDSDLQASLDSEHAWNVSEHATEATARENSDSDLQASLDSEHAWNVTQHATESTARENADSDLNVRLDSEHGWNVTQHATESTARENADSDLNVRLDSEHGWNVIEHLGLYSAIDSLAENIVAGLIIDSDAPTDPSIGDMWLDLNDYKVKIYNGDDVWFDFPGVSDDNEGATEFETPISVSEGDIRVALYADPDLSAVGTVTDDPFSIITGNVLRATVDENGNLGVGTSTPSAQLHVSGDIDGTQAIFSPLDNGTRGLKISTFDADINNAGVDLDAQGLNGENGTLTLSTVGSTRLRIDPDGKINFIEDANAHQNIGLTSVDEDRETMRRVAFFTRNSNGDTVGGMVGHDGSNLIINGSRDTNDRHLTVDPAGETSFSGGLEVKGGRITGTRSGVYASGDLVIEGGDMLTLKYLNGDANSTAFLANAIQGRVAINGNTFSDTITLHGNTTVNGNLTTSGTVNAQEFTKNGSALMKTMTQAQYNGITPDPNTVYFIV